MGLSLKPATAVFGSNDEHTDGKAETNWLPIMQRILSLAVVATQLRTSAKGLGHDR